MSRVIEHADREAFACAVAAEARRWILHGLREEGHARAALAGGSTPAAVLPLLFASTDVDWRNVALTVSDERQVPLDDPLSNSGQIERLRVGTPAGAARFVPLDALHLFPLHLVWAGIGEDGHTLSWFPGPDLNACYTSAEAVIAVRPDPLPEAAPVARVTLTLTAANAAHTIIVAATGAAKRAILDEPDDYPVARLLALPQTVVHWAP